MFRDGTSFQQILKSVEKELGAQASRTPEGAIRNSIGTRCRILLQSNEFIKLGTIKEPTNVVRSFLNVPQDIFELVMSGALDAGLKNGPQYSQSLLPDASSFVQGMTVFISDRIETKHRFFGTPGTLSTSASGWRIVFLRLCPREIRYLCFTFRKTFTSKVRNNLAEPLEIIAFRRDRLKQVTNGLPCLTTSHERPKMSFSVGT